MKLMMQTHKTLYTSLTLRITVCNNHGNDREDLVLQTLTKVETGVHPEHFRENVKLYTQNRSKTRASFSKLSHRSFRHFVTMYVLHTDSCNFRLKILYSVSQKSLFGFLPISRKCLGLVIQNFTHLFTVFIHIYP